MTNWLRQVAGTKTYEDDATLANGFIGQDLLEKTEQDVAARHKDTLSQLGSHLFGIVDQATQEIQKRQQQTAQALTNNVTQAMGWLDERINRPPVEDTSPAPDPWDRTQGVATFGEQDDTRVGLPEAPLTTREADEQLDTRNFGINPPAPQDDPSKPSAFTAAGEALDRGAQALPGLPDFQRGTYRGAANVLRQMGSSADEARQAAAEGDTIGAASGIAAGVQAGLGLAGSGVHGGAIEEGAPEPIANVAGLAADVAMPATLLDDVVGLALKATGKLTAAGLSKVAQSVGVDPQAVVQHALAKGHEVAGAVGRAIGEGADTLARVGEQAPEARLGVVPPEVARRIPMETRVPDMPELADAVANTPGASLTDDGILLTVARNNNPDQSGAASIRTGVFYLPDPKSKYLSQYRGKNGYGGTERIEGETLLRAPLVVKGATGGKAPENAYDFIKGKGAYEEMRNDVLDAVGRAFGRRDEDEVIQRVRDVLELHGGAPNLAEDIYYVSNKGNQLPYAIQEHIVAAAVRDAGYDSVLGYSKARDGKHFLSEVFDVREASYPDQEGFYRLHDQFKPRPADSLSGKEGGIVSPSPQGQGLRSALAVSTQPVMARAASTAGERAFDLGTGAVGGVVSAATAPEDASPQDRLARGAAGFALGTLGGANLRQLGRAGSALAEGAEEGIARSGKYRTPPLTPAQKIQWTKDRAADKQTFDAWMKLAGKPGMEDLGEELRFRMGRGEAGLAEAREVIAQNPEAARLVGNVLEQPARGLKGVYDDAAGIVAGGAPTTKAGQVRDTIQKARYFNTLWQLGGAAADVISTGINIPRLWGQTALGALNERDVDLAVRATTRGELTGMAEGWKAAGGWTGAWEALRDVLWKGSDPVATEQAQTLTRGPVGLLAEAGPRLRIATDTVGQKVGRSMGDYMLAYREADRAGLVPGSPNYVAKVERTVRAIQDVRARGPVKQGGTALPVKREVRDVLGTQTRTVTETTPEALARESETIAKRMIFQQELGEKAKALGGLRGDTGPLGFLVLFYKTLANIGAEGVTMAPVAGELGRLHDVRAAQGAERLFVQRDALRTRLANATSAEQRAAIQEELDGIAQKIGKAGPYAGDAGDVRARTTTAAVLPASQRRAQQQMGWGAMVAGGLAAGAGLITDAGPANKSERDKLRETGWRPYALNVAGHYIPVMRVLGPAAVPLVMGAALTGEFKRTGRIDQAVVRSVLEASGQWFDLAGMRSFYDLLELGAKTRDPQAVSREAERMVASQLGTLIPGPLRFAENMSDTVQRDPKGLWQELAAQIPGLAGTVPPQKTSSGQLVKRSKWQGLSPVQIIESQPNANKAQTAAQIRAAARRQAAKPKDEGFPIAAIARGLQDRLSAASAGGR